MDVTINTSQPTQGTNSSSAGQTGAAAAQTESQRADATAERVVASAEKQNLENDVNHAEKRRLDLIKKTAAHFSSGDNSFLSDIKFTVYNQSHTAGGDYEIRFTDLSTGAIEIKNDVELLGTASAGEVISGSI